MMIPAILLLSSSIATQASPAPTPGWVTVTSKAGTFDFAMPAKANERAVNQKSPEGATFSVLEYSCLAGDCLYRIEESRMPAEVPDEKLTGALKASRDSIARKVKILGEKETAVAGWPARELTIEAPLKPGAAPSKVAMLICYADNRFYQVRVFALTPGDDPKDVRAFFDAFRPRKAGPAAKPGP